jgi:nicotinate-nucleotide pyrophosphorylase (carboxylating)
VNGTEFEAEVERSLFEDLRLRGDITTSSIVSAAVRARGSLVSREAGVLAGLNVAKEVMRKVDAEIVLSAPASDGDRIEAGQVVATVEGPAAGLLVAERTALNYVGHLSGIASATRKLVDAVEGTGATILDTRKTTPGLRLLEKYAVRMGGGRNHRVGLYDGVLIKDNHIAVAGGVAQAIRKVRGALGPEYPIEVEVESLEQLGAALEEGVWRVLLDNMNLGLLREAVGLAKGRAETEASGGVRLETVRSIAETGVDFISVGWITHSAPNLDIALEMEKA